MFPVMILTIVFGALVHVHGAFWFALLPCVALLACYAHTFVYGDLAHERWYGWLYVRAKITDSDYFVIDRKGSKRVQWVEVGTVHQKGKSLFTFTLGCFTFQIGTQPAWMTHDFLNEKKEKVFRSESTYTDSSGQKRELTPEESAAITGYFKQAGSYMESAFAELTKLHEKLKKGNKE